MRYRKTPKKARKTYKLFNEEGKLIAELKPNENGVTADMIQKLHRIDDNEVYVNCKELRQPSYLDKSYAEWKKQYILHYIQEYKTEPKVDEIPSGHRQFVYLDDTKNNISIQLELSCSFNNEPSEPVQLLRELIAQMPQRWQEVYRLSMLMEYTNVETAKMLGVTESRIRAVKKKIIDRIRCDENLKKYFL